jgi:acyl-CoA thioesterase FadM
MATAHFVLVSTNRADLKPVPIPEVLRAALQTHMEN